MDLGPQWVDLTSHPGQQSPDFEMRSHPRSLGVGKWLWVLPFAKEVFRTVVLNVPNTVALQYISSCCGDPNFKIISVDRKSVV